MREADPLGHSFFDEVLMKFRVNNAWKTDVHLLNRVYTPKYGFVECHPIKSKTKTNRDYTFSRTSLVCCLHVFASTWTVHWIVYVWIS